MKAMLNEDTYHLCRSEWIVRLGVQNVSKTFCQLKMIKKCKNANLPIFMEKNMLDSYDEVKLWDLIRSSGLFERCKQRVDIQTFVLWNFLVIKPAGDKYFEAQVLGKTRALRLAQRESQQRMLQ